MFYDRYVQLCEQKDVKPSRAAIDAGVPKSAVSNWKENWRNGIEVLPSNKNARKIAQYFGVAVDYIVGAEEPPQIKAPSSSVRIPVLGRIPAGIPIEAIEEVLDYEEIPTGWTVGNKEYFALKIEGDSMAEKYQSGDVVIFLRAETCDSGEECAVMVNGDDATFKKVIRQKNGIILQPLNISKYEPRFYSNEDIANLPVRVLGIAKEIRRKA